MQTLATASYLEEALAGDDVGHVEPRTLEQASERRLSRLAGHVAEQVVGCGAGRQAERRDARVVDAVGGHVERRVDEDHDVVVDVAGAQLLVGRPLRLPAGGGGD